MQTMGPRLAQVPRTQLRVGLTAFG